MKVDIVVKEKGNADRLYKEVTYTQQVKVHVALKEKGNSDRLYKEVTHTQQVVCGTFNIQSIS